MTTHSSPNPPSLEFYAGQQIAGQERDVHAEADRFTSPEQASIWMLAASEVLDFHTDGTGIDAETNHSQSRRTFTIKFDDAAGGTYRIAGDYFRRGYTQAVTGDHKSLTPNVNISIAYTTGHETEGAPVVTREIARYETTRSQRKWFKDYDDKVEYGDRIFEGEPRAYVPSMGELTPPEQRRTRTKEDVQKLEGLYVACANLTSTMLLNQLSQTKPEVIKKIEERNNLYKGMKTATLLHRLRLRSDTSQ